jgi:hypothetical protein
LTPLNIIFSLPGYVISNNTFIENYAPAGGAIIISTGNFGDTAPDGRSVDNTFIYNSAFIGAAVFLDIGPNTLFWKPSLEDLCEHYSVAKGNVATWGNLCSSYPHSIDLGKDLPSVLWPGLKFDVSVQLLDRYNTTIKYAIAPVSVFMHNAIESRNATVAVPNSEAHYVFKDLRVDSNSTSETINFVLRSGPLHLEISVTVPISRCPPAFQERILDSGLAGCEPCAPGFYTLAEDTDCKSCVEEDEESHGEEHSHGDEGHGCLSPPSFEDSDLKDSLRGTHSSANWRISSGFYPSPSPLKPTQLLPCLNHEACRDIECSLITEDVSSLKLNCSIHCNVSDSFFSCLCQEGYTDRLL